MSRLVAEAADNLLRQVELAAAVEVVNSGATGDLEFRIEVTHLSHLPIVDFFVLELERLTSKENDERLPKIFQDRLREQILNFLDSRFEFPVAPAMVRNRIPSKSSVSFAELQSGG